MTRQLYERGHLRITVPVTAVPTPVLVWAGGYLPCPETLVNGWAQLAVKADSLPAEPLALVLRIGFLTAIGGRAPSAPLAELANFQSAQESFDPGNVGAVTYAGLGNYTLAGALDDVLADAVRLEVWAATTLPNRRMTINLETALVVGYAGKGNTFRRRGLSARQVPRADASPGRF